MIGETGRGWKAGPIYSDTQCASAQSILTSTVPMLENAERPPLIEYQHIFRYNFKPVNLRIWCMYCGYELVEGPSREPNGVGPADSVCHVCGINYGVIDGKYYKFPGYRTRRRPRNCAFPAESDCLDIPNHILAIYAEWREKFKFINLPTINMKIQYKDGSIDYSPTSPPVICFWNNDGFYLCSVKFEQDGRALFYSEHMYGYKATDELNIAMQYDLNDPNCITDLESAIQTVFDKYPHNFLKPVQTRLEKYKLIRH